MLCILYPKQASEAFRVDIYHFGQISFSKHVIYSGHSIFSFQPSQPLSLAAFGEEMEAILDQLLNPSIFVADLLHAHPVLLSLISEAGSSVPHHSQDNLFMCVLDPTSSPGLGNLLSHFQARIQPNV